ncbi:hypothetical protein [Cryobacterium sp. GrIS_2_6]|uniref:hypothetical protein n=1 Tax=Cryobacterium sp. GrIS_2_6 TaxID=3162785 RepID=UPI002E021EEB|nr:Arc/MetJ-type ribon-helix-helix transcriptional regulator [Cryobacterium psychrotolerans]
MTRQIAIRLSDDLVDFIDRTIAAGSEGSRAAVITRALEREQRRMLAERDIKILSASHGANADDGLDDLARFAATLPAGSD